MKKIENVLLLLALMVLCWPRSGYPDLNMENDTKLLVTGILLVLYIFYKIIRKRHNVVVSVVISRIHVIVTILYIGTMLIRYTFRDWFPNGFYDESSWIKFVVNTMSAMIVMAFIAGQIMFLIYFTIRLIQKPLRTPSA